MRLLDILIPMILVALWLMPLSLPKKIWRLFRGKIEDDDWER
jgi:hypothetical protein